MAKPDIPNFQFNAGAAFLTLVEALNVLVSGTNPDGTPHVLQVQLADQTGTPSPISAPSTFGGGALEVAAKLNSGFMEVAEAEVVVKSKVIDHGASGDNELVAAVVGKKIRVVNIAFVVAAAVTVRFESGAGGTALSGQMQFPANGGMAPGYCPHGHFDDTAAGAALNMELSGAVSVDGWLKYIEV